MSRKVHPFSSGPRCPSEASSGTAHIAQSPVAWNDPGVRAFRYDPSDVVTTTNNTGYSSAYQNPFTFGENIRDCATGEVKFGKRFYSPVTGNWTQQDTLNAPLDPSNANRYQYAADNPINIADATGRSIFGDILAGVGVVAGVAALVTLGPETGIAAGLATVTGSSVGFAGAAYEYGCDATGGC